MQTDVERGCSISMQFLNETTTLSERVTCAARARRTNSSNDMIQSIEKISVTMSLLSAYQSSLQKYKEALDSSVVRKSLASSPCQVPSHLAQVLRQVPSL